jgi:uncharacterized membrane protein YeiB
VTALLASVLASLVTWPVTALLNDRVSDATNLVVGFVLWAVVFVPAFVWLKRLRSGG